MAFRGEAKKKNTVLHASGSCYIEKLISHNNFLYFPVRKNTVLSKTSISKMAVHFFRPSQSDLSFLVGRDGDQRYGDEGSCSWMS